MIRWTSSTSSVLRLAAFSAVFAIFTLAGCGGTTGSSSSPGVSSVPPPTSSPPPTSPPPPPTAGQTVTPDPITLSSANVSVSQGAGTVSLTVTRSGAAATASASVDYATSDSTAVDGTDYTNVSGTLNWAENDTTAKTISVPISNANPFSGVRAFAVTLTNPQGDGASIGSPGAATVSISGDAVPQVGSVELSDANYSVTQNTGTITVTVNRAGGSSGAVSVAFATSDGSAVAGTDYTAASGVLQWADGDAVSKTFEVAVSTAKGFSGTRTFNVALSDPRSGVTVGTPSSAVVSITGSGSAPPGSLQLSASSYSVSQGAGSEKVSVIRTGGSSGAISVSYATSNGTAVAGTDFTSKSGTLNWSDGDTGSKSFSVTISNSSPFSGSKTFKVALSKPSSTTTIGSPGAATVTINGDAAPPPGTLMLSSSSYTVGQGAGSVTVTVKRTNGSNGAASVAYATSSGTAVAGTDFTSKTGTLNWSDGDSSSKTFPVPISNSSPFSGTRSFSVKINNASGASLGSPSSASVAINGDAAAAVGSLQLSASSYTVAQSAGSLSVSVHRTGGSSGSISVKYATSDGSAVAGTDYTATSGTVNWADGDAASKSFSIPISNATGFSGSKTFTVALSNATSGATLSSPSSAGVTINGSGSNSGGSSGTFWVYHNGVFSWGGDYSWGVTIDYRDTSGVPLSGPYDIAVTGIGGFQPFATNYDFDTTGYKYLVFSLKPTVANQTWDSGFYQVGDIQTGVILNVLNYGPAPAVGQWTTYKIPLGSGGYQIPTGTHIYKFMIQDQTADMPNSGMSTNHWYVDNIYFSPN